MSFRSRRMMDWPAVRARFPAAARFTYLNAAAAPPLSDLARNEGQRFYEEMYRDGDAPWDRWLAEVEEVRVRLAGFLGATPDEVAFTSSTSHGMNLAAQMLHGRGDVVTMADEFPTATLPWLRQGCRLRFVPSADRGVIRLGDVERAITPDTRILVASSVQYATGFRQDLAALGELCRRYGLAFVVDATQGLGVFPVDVRTCGIDVLTFSGYKWMMAGYGNGGLYVASSVLHAEGSPVAGWLSARHPDRLVNDRLDLRTTAAVVEVGCPGFAGIFALGGALSLIEEIGLERIRDRVHELTDYLHASLTRRGFSIASPSHRRHRSGITIVRMERPEEVVTRLADRGILVSARGEGLRVSVHVYNDTGDIDRLVEALGDVNVA